MAVLGGSLKRRERISAVWGYFKPALPRLAVLKRYDDEGRNEADLPLVHWGVQDALYQAEQAMDDLLQNFPNRVVAGLLNVVIFPTGRHYLALLTSWIIKWRRFTSAERHPFPHWSRSVPDAERA
ncbi:acyl-CoA dehydrogenase [Escherichia coli]|uniref:Acyl-CoA dehydrogenase n=1 Tax=Escherichia coli TaxID=562 RepID=A0A377E2S3_ECOLX|nr:acyl-CoA dehydrogenase [Escherichia coli]